MCPTADGANPSSSPPPPATVTVTPTKPAKTTAEAATVEAAAATKSNRYVVMFLVGLAALVQTLVYSIPMAALSQYVLYRDEVHLRLTQGQLGVIVAASTGATVIAQPLIGRLLVSTVSDKLMLSLGLLINSVFTLLKAGVVFCRSSPGQLYAFAIGCHALASIGHSMSSIALYVSLGAYLSDINHLMLPLIEVAIGLGMVAGPLIGGTLYKAGGGLVTVYAAAGGFGIASAVLMATLHPGALKRNCCATVEDGPNGKDAVTSTSHSTSAAATYSILLRAPIIVNIIIIANCYCMLFYNDVTLTSRLVEVIPDFWQAGYSLAVYSVAGASFAFLGLAFGYLAKVVSDARLLLLVALVVGALAWFPTATLFSARANLVYMYAGQFLIGFAASPMYVCSYWFTLKYLGGADDPSVYALVSGAFNPAANLGSAAGQLISNYLSISTDSSTLSLPIGPDLAMVAMNAMLAVLLVLTMYLPCLR